VVGGSSTRALGQPEDVARLIAFLAGEDGGWITGQVIRSTGGFVAKE
jgi:3-oxoacyl-[acyl-carrier protein] reductase